MNEPGVRDEERHHATDGGERSARRPDVDEKLPPETAQPGDRLSGRRVLVLVLIALLVAGAVVAHLLTGPGVSH